MKEHLVASSQAVVKTLAAINDLIVVVAAPFGSGVSTEILQTHRKCEVFIGQLCEAFDWYMLVKRAPPMITVDVDEISWTVLRLILEGAAGTRIILRTGPEIPARLAHLPTIRMQ